jgi:hypothetical protein
MALVVLNIKVVTPRLTHPGANTMSITTSTTRVIFSYETSFRIKVANESRGGWRVKRLRVVMSLITRVARSFQHN